MNFTKKIGQALIAGSIAIAVNILLLRLADGLGIATAGGGLQRLVKLWIAIPVTRSGVGELWASLGLPGPDTTTFKMGFKVTVGLAMALFYALALEPRLAGNALAKGLVYAVFAWALNAFIVLPLLGNGIAGWHELTAFGMVCFAVAHTAFFITLALGYEMLRRRL